MSRRVDGSRRYVRTSGGLPPIAPPIIGSVSQTQGTIDGSTVVTITGSNFKAGMTSALGAVSAITSTSATITTNAHAAGAFTWTVTTTQGSAANQTFTYLAHPAGISAGSHARQTIATSIIFTLTTGLPAIGSGVPMTVTVDGNACSSIAILSSTTFSALVPTDTTSGAKDVVVTIDGVAGTGVGALTYDPPPVDISSTNVSNSGGSGVITGLNFVSGATASVLINGVTTALTIAFVNSQKLNFTLAAGSYTAGTWNLTVLNPDGQSDVEPIFQIASTSDPQTIFGANLYAWYRADSLSAGLISSWPDKSANAFNLTAAGSARPTANASSANGFLAQPTVTFDGSANTMSVSGCAATGTNTLFAYVIFRWTTSASAKYCLSIAGASDRLAIGCTGGFGHNIVSYYSSVTTNATAVEAAAVAPVGIYGASVGSGLIAESVQYNIANLAEIDTAGTGTQPSSIDTRSIYVGADNGAAFAPVEIAEIVISKAKPGTSDALALYQYFNFRYGLEPAMSYTRSLDVLATTGTESRVAGAGFNAMSSAAIVVSGTPMAVTTTFLNTGSISLSASPLLGAGQYDLVITNMNSGQALIVSNAINVTTTKNPASIGGRNLVLWNTTDAADLLFNGSNISAFVDLACISPVTNTCQQSTAADQAPWTSSDANYSGQPSATFGGTPVKEATVGSIVFDKNPSGHSYTIFLVSRVTTLVGPNDCAAITSDFMRFSGAKPSIRSSGGSVVLTWGSSTLNTAIAYYMQRASTGSGTETYQMDVNASGAITASGTDADFVQGQVIIGASPTAFFQGSIREIAIFDTALTSGQLADMFTYAATRH